jgi:hypothetical protein
MEERFRPGKALFFLPHCVKVSWKEVDCGIDAWDGEKRTSVLRGGSDLELNGTRYQVEGSLVRTIGPKDSLLLDFFPRRPRLLRRALMCCR